MSQSALDYRTNFKPKERGSSMMKDIQDFLKNKKSAIFMEQFETNSFETLVEAEKAAKSELLDNPDDIKLRATWLFFACLKRDVQYGRRGYKWLSAVGYDNMFREAYGGAKAAVDTGVQ